VPRHVLLPCPASWNKWETTNFGDEGKNEKFRKLMGIKATPAVQPSAAPASTSSVPGPDQQVGQGAGQLTLSQHRIQSDLESQYEVGRQQTHRNK
jgi:hypothetical protein